MKSQNSRKSESRPNRNEDSSRSAGRGSDIRSPDQADSAPQRIAFPQTITGACVQGIAPIRLRQNHEHGREHVAFACACGKAVLTDAMLPAARRVAFHQVKRALCGP
jgi:hypothetical protein